MVSLVESGTMEQTRILLKKIIITSEAYDYIENDHKPYEEIVTLTINQGYFKWCSSWWYIPSFFEANTDFILEGMANTRRFAKVIGMTYYNIML
ncbi:MAG: hypothetical protein U0354_11180 [Candidatus Sericytochromatia bacterium]